MDRYYITERDEYGEDKEREVTKIQWIRYERLAGFYPKCSRSDPRYDNECATAGFSHHSKLRIFSGRIISDEIRPSRYIGMGKTRHESGLRLDE